MGEQHMQPQDNQAEQRPANPGMSETELQEQQAADLPDREAMSLVNANLAAPINTAVALNALSDNSTAQAAAVQTAPIDQAI